MSQHVETVKEAYAAFGRGDVAAVIALLDEEVEWTAPEILPHGGHAHGHEEVGAFFGGLVEMWSDFDLDITDIVDGGERAIAFGRASGKLRGADSGYGFVHIFTFDGDKVTRFDEYVAPPAGGFPGAEPGQPS